MVLNPNGGYVFPVVSDGGGGGGGETSRNPLELLYTEGAEITPEDWGSANFGQNFNAGGALTDGLNFAGAKIKKITFPDTQIISIGFPYTGGLEEYDSGSSMSASGTTGGMGQWIFYNCTNLKKLTMGENFLPFANYAFGYCNSLTGVRYKGTIDKWAMALRNANYQRAAPFGYSGGGSFYLSDSAEPLTEIVLTTANQVYGGAFYNFTGITKADIGTSVESIGASAFYGCSNLDTVILRGDTVKTLSNVNAFNNTPFARGTGFFYIDSTDPTASIAEYEAATNWSTYVGQFKPISELGGGE